MYGAERAARIAEANQELSYPDVLSLHGDEPPDGDAVDARARSSASCTARARSSIARDFYPMDEGSAVIAAIARACGDDVLDLAAAPGGKSIYMAHRGARVIANDVSLTRLRRCRTADPARRQRRTQAAVRDASSRSSCSTRRAARPARSARTPS